MQELESYIEKILPTNSDWYWPKWPLKIFIHDDQVYPCHPERNILALLNANDDYLKYFQESRGFNRPLGQFPNLWKIIMEGSVILYFENEITELLLRKKEPSLEDQNLVEILARLSKSPISEWEKIKQSK